MLSLSRPSVVLLDFDLGTERALTFLDQARAAGFTGRVLILTAGVSEFEAIQLIQAGVSGIFHKHNSKDMLCETIQRVAAGEVCLEKCYMKHVFRTIDQTQSGVISLTGRDKSILHMVFQGLSNKEIGIQLDLSEGTVKAAVRQLFHKFGVHTRAQMVKVALEEYADQL
jgi:two-component system nitrate/nitrite response regulator NarL